MSADAARVALPPPSHALVQNMNAHMARMVEAAGLDADAAAPKAQVAFASPAIKAIVDRVSAMQATPDDYLALVTFLKKAEAFAEKIVANAIVPKEHMGGRASFKRTPLDCLVPDAAPLFLRTRVQYARGHGLGWPLTAESAQALDAMLANGPVDLHRHFKAEANALKTASKMEQLKLERQLMVNLLKAKFPGRDFDDIMAEAVAEGATKAAAKADAQAAARTDGQAGARATHIAMGLIPASPGDSSPKSALQDDSDDEELSSSSDDEQTPAIAKPARAPVTKPPLAPTKTSKPGVKRSLERQLDAAAVPAPLKRTRA